MPFNSVTLMTRLSCCLERRILFWKKKLLLPTTTTHFSRLGDVRSPPSPDPPMCEAPRSSSFNSLPLKTPTPFHLFSLALAFSAVINNRHKVTLQLGFFARLVPFSPVLKISLSISGSNGAEVAADAISTQLF